ncbi:flagellar hook-length control protein FliK [Aurantimonas coralicida]|uniref:flagellar hook-length control protein FliK n=1 Tax=Aurantimonas coralicida TaxID=182270 RepID=UPI00239C9855|nr:flagellar hook-length control protein FliK [Aurantimonas coralicida]MDE0922828.1 flagellar hook-length control protein FliK [Aurantimonas coralicida]
MTASVSTSVEMRAPATRSPVGRGAESATEARDAFDSFVKDAEQAPKATRSDSESRDTREAETDETKAASSEDAAETTQASGREAEAAPSGRPRDNGLAAILADMDRLLRSGTATAATMANAADGEATTTADGKAGTAADAALARTAMGKDEKVANPLARFAANDADETVSRIAAAAGEALGANKTANAAAAQTAGEQARAQVDLVSQRTDFEPATTAAGASAVAAGKPGGAATTNIRQLLASVDMRAGNGATPDGEGGPAVDGETGDVFATGEGNETRRGRSEPRGERAAFDRNPRADNDGNRNAAAGVSPKVAETAAPGLAAAGAPPTIGRQVADAVSTSLTGAPLPTGDTAEAARVQMRAGGAALKTIQIQLQPEQLGKLDVTMRLIDGKLAIHIVASEADTALRIKDDAEGLNKLLTKAGFSVDEAAISIGVRDAGAPRGGIANAQGQADGQASTGQSQNGAARDGAASFGGEGSARQGSGRPEQPMAASPAEETGARRRELDPSVYL